MNNIKDLLRPGYYATVSQMRIYRSKSYFNKLRNQHRGKRGFVIGNGPSLKMTDLDQLTREVTIASNKIYLAFNSTRWRPDYFTIVDRLVWEKVQPDLRSHKLKPIIPSYLHDTGTSSLTFRHLGSAADAFLKNGAISFSNNASQGMFGGYTVTFQNLQLAVHLGLNPIYILGCDHYYSGEEEIEHGTPTTHGATSNHFLANYRSAGEIVNPAPIAKMDAAYSVAAKYALKTGIEIRNATRGGHLEAFPRIDFDGLWSN